MKTLLILAVLFSTAAASANALEKCNYDEMLKVAISDSLITQIYGEQIVHSGGPYRGTPEGALLVADLVSASGYREIKLIDCDANGKITSSGGSVRQGKVVFSK